MAETYHIFDYRSLPVQRVATFCMGLRRNSRLKMKLMNSKVPFETLLMAVAVDQLKILVWSKTKDAQKGMNKPKLIAENLMNVQIQHSNNLSFSSPEEFEKAKNEILLKGGD